METLIASLLNVIGCGAYVIGVFVGSAVLVKFCVVVDPLGTERERST